MPNPREHNARDMVLLLGARGGEVQRREVAMRCLHWACGGREGLRREIIGVAQFSWRREHQDERRKKGDERLLFEIRRDRTVWIL